MAKTVEELGARVFIEGLNKFESDAKAAGKAIDKNAKSFDEAEKEAEGYSDSLEDAAASTVALTKETDKSAKSADESQKRFKVFGLTLNDLKSGVDLVAGGIRKFAEAVKKGLEFAELGAVALQVEESFNRTRRELDLDVDILRQLQNAVDNTIPKQQLMASAQTLVAGTSKAFGAAMLENLPRLAQYAKASNKLNPALGDTSFLLESIATGLKRGSPMILDNLGLVVKVGEANKVYAAQLGKTVDELNAEEKQMALLNDVMRAGDRLIEQVGGTTDSATDSIQQFAAATEDAKTEFALWWQEVVKGSGAVEVATKKLTAATAKLRFDRLIKEGIELGVVTEEQIERWDRLQTARGPEEKRLAAIEELTAELTEAIEKENRELKANESSVLALGPAYAQYQKTLPETTAATEELTEKTIEAEDANIRLSKAAINMAEAERDAALAAEEAAAAQDFANGIYGIAISKLDGYGEANRRAALASQALKLITGELTHEQLAQNAAIAGLTEDYINGKLTLDEYTAAVGSLADGTTAAADVVANQMSPSLDELEVDAFLAKKEVVLLTDELGNLADESPKVRLDFQALTTALGKAEALMRKIREIGSASVSVGGFQVPDVGAIGGGQFGGQVFPGEPVLVGERGPEIFVPQNGGRIAPNMSITDARQFNLTAQSVMRPGGLEMEFERMDLGSR